MVKRTFHSILASLLLLSCAEPAPHRRTRPRAMDMNMDMDTNMSVDAGSQHESGPPGFCARDDADDVRDVFCAADPAPITSLSDLQKLLNLNPHAPNPLAPAVADPMPDNPHAGVNSLIAMSHSTSLSGQLVSPINPRVLIMADNSIMAFTRGVQRVELTTLSRTTGDLNFYLVSFEQACNESKRGCGPGDLYTPAIETDWNRVKINDGEELKNTAFDCRQCHQRNTDKPVLLMREFDSPWTHFFGPDDEEYRGAGFSGSFVIQDYFAAKGDEIYAGYDLSTISIVGPFIFQRRVGGVQPLYFDAPKIFKERYPDGYPGEPQPSQTWEDAYEAFKRGEQLAVPYVDHRATDPQKQSALTDAYRRYRDGELEASELPDLAEIYPDDPELRSRMGLQVEPDATAQDALIQACGSCHNDVLDQSLSRARFNIDVSRLDRKELDLAIERIQRPRSEHGAMPPAEARQLHPDALARLISYLEATPEPDPRLERAAQLGMNGGGIRTQVLF